jgi:signal transduction histidine kinase
MERFLDFRPSADPQVNPQWLQAEPLLACYQSFLGHDLPGQLVALQGLARLLLLQSASLPAETVDLLGRLAGITQKVDALVRRVADLGRIQREPPFGPPVSLADVVGAAAAEVRCTGLSLECALAGDVSTLPLSRRLFHQVLVQLFRNAAQAALTGSVGHVEVQGQKHPSAFPGWSCAIQVRDQGRGLTAEQLPRLFLPLVQSSVAEGGIGLGLFQVRQIVGHWQGGLHVWSEPGQGTAFTLVLREW